MQEESDLPFEEDILRNPYSVKAWWRYLEHKRTAPRAVRNMVYERALKEIPGSYKIWYAPSACIIRAYPSFAPPKRPVSDFPSARTVQVRISPREAAGSQEQVRHRSHV